MLLAPMFLAASGAERFFEDVPLETVAVLIRPRIFNMRPKESGAKHLGVTVFCFFHTRLSLEIHKIYRLYSFMFTV